MAGADCRFFGGIARLWRRDCCGYSIHPRRFKFWRVVAVLTATMGDAAFLLLAKEPLAALAVFAICAPTGVVFGYLVDWIHGRDFEG